MNTGKQREARPAERGLAWIVTFLLTVILTVTLLGFSALQMITSARMHLSVAADDSMLDRQLQAIYNDIDLMAAEYGFSSDEVKAAVSREELEEYNRKAAEWWTRLLTEGEGGAVPQWYSGSLEDLIYAEAEEKELGEKPQTIITDLTEMIENTVLPVRETTLAFGSKLAKEKADIRGIIRSVQKLPTLGILLSLACAGLIALLLGRDLFSSLKYYGTAAAATGITVLAASIALVLSHPEQMIAEASTGLAREFGTLMSRIETGAFLAAVILLAGGYLCLFLYRRRAKRNSSDAGMTE